MEEALNELEKISKDDKIIGLYDKEKVEEKIMNTKIEGAKLEGKKEVAKKLIELNIDLNSISIATGLSIDELKKDF